MKASLPVRGAWIEIAVQCAKLYRRRRRSPCGERGLKCVMLNRITSLTRSLPVRGAWIEMVETAPDLYRRIVAPRAGSVD